MIMGRDKSEAEVVEILEHGFKVLADNNLQAFPFTLRLADSIGANTYGVEAYELPEESGVAWADWRLVWNGEEYPPKYATREEWEERWAR
jgi:hypothetical protein